MSDTDTPAEAPVRRRTQRTPRPQRRPQMSRDDVRAAADRAEKPKQRFKMKAAPNWESEDFVGVGQDGADRLGISLDTLLALEQDGWSLQWGTHAIRGQPAPQELAKMTKGGWTPVHQEDFEGMLNGQFMPKGKNDTPIIVDDSILLARPLQIQQKAERVRRREANLPLQIAEEQIGQGIPGVTGAMAPGVRNSIKKTMERVEIPD